MIRIILTTICLFLVALLAHAQEKKALYTINNQEIHLEFTTKYQFDDLTKVKSALENLDITIVFTSLQFDEEGYLKQISAAIKYPDGMGGSFVSEKLQPEGGPGFRRDL